MNVLISGYYGFDNAGDELILGAMLLDLRRLLPATEITVFSNNPVKTARLHRTTAIPRWNILRVMKAVREADILLSGGGGVLQDITNRYNILYYLGIIAFAELFRKKTAIYSQGIGPIRKKVNRLLTRWILNKVNLITVRDENSKVLLQTLGVNKEVRVAADPTLNLRPNIGHRTSDIGHRAPVIGICVRRWKDFTGEAIAETADYLVRGKNARIIFIPFHLPDDYLVSRRIKNMMGEEAKIDLYKQLQDLINVFSEFDLVLSMRLHGLILAALYGIPMIGISFDPKIASFTKALGQKTVTITVDKKELTDKIEEVWRRKDFFIQQIHSRLPPLQRRAKLAPKLVANLIDKDIKNRQLYRIGCHRNRINRDSEETCKRHL